jgi:anaerobic ribonucleoside-triphosphate reductase activating protein
MEININSIDYSGSIVDGPGIRTVLFVQGCEHYCIGCHNPSTWDFNKGKKRNIEHLIKELRANVINKKLTISGGEPLLQYPAILELIKGLPDFNIVLYTGFEYKDIPKKLVNYLDHIKVGKFIQNKRCTMIPYIGSTNQQFLNLGEVL